MSYVVNIPWYCSLVDVCTRLSILLELASLFLSQEVLVAPFVFRLHLNSISP